MIIVSAVTVCAVLGAVTAIIIWRVKANKTSEGGIMHSNKLDGYSTINITSDPAKGV